MTVGELVVKIKADMGDLEDALSAGGGKIAAFADRVTSLGQTLTLGLTVPLIGAAGAAVKFASDAAESASKFDVVFGDAAASVGQAIVEMRATIPATTSELKGMTSEIQDLLVPMGLAPAAAKDMTLQVVQLAADLASFNNIPMAEALERIRSGLVGQNEPLLKFGVAINAAAVQAEALRLGLIKTEKEGISPAARAQATFSLILQDTTAAQGDAARTAASTANQFKFLTAETVEAATSFGVLLLPAVTSVVSSLVGAVRTFQDMDGSTKKVILVVGGLVAALGPLLVLVGGTASAIASLSAAAGVLGIGMGALAATILAIPAAFAAVVAVVVTVAKHWDVLSFEAKRLMDAIATQFARFEGIAQTALHPIDTVVGGFKKMFDILVGHSVVPDLMDRIGGEFDRLDPLMVSPAQEAADRVNAAFKGIRNPEALRALDFDVSMDAAQLYAAVIEGGQQLNQALIDLSSKTRVAGGVTEAFSTNTANAITAAALLAEEHRAAQQAAANMRHQQDILATIVGTKEVPARNANIVAMAAMTSQQGQVTSGLISMAAGVQATRQIVEIEGTAFGRVMSSVGGFVSDTGSVLGSSLSKLGGGALDLLAKFSPMGLATETLQRVFKELEPAIKAVEPIVVILAKAIASGLMPILQALFPVIKLIAIAFTFAGEIVYRVAQGFLFVIGNVVRAIGKLIDALPFVSGKGIIDAGEALLGQADAMGDAAKAMNEARDELKQLQWPSEAAAAAAEQVTATNAVTEAVTANSEQAAAAVAALQEQNGILAQSRDILREIREGIGEMAAALFSIDFAPVIQITGGGSAAVVPGGPFTSGSAGSGSFALDEALGGGLDL